MNLKYDEPPSNLAFISNLRHHTTEPAAGMFLVPVTVLAVLAASLAPALRGRGLHSSTFRLDVSTLCGYIV